MLAVEFAYWLQGYAEITGGSPTLTPVQLSVVYRHLELVRAVTPNTENLFGAERSARLFCDWLYEALQTYFSLPDVGDYDAAVKDHYNKGVQANLWVKLNALFEHVVDKAYAGDQNVFNSAHSGKEQSTPQFGSEGIRC